MGIVRSENLNATLIGIYKYANKCDNLWRRIMSAKNGADLNRLLPSFNSSAMESLLFNLIGLLLDINAKVFDLVHHWFRTITGNGLNAEFWSDDWIGLGPLKVIFLKIYAFLAVKQGKVASFGNWNQGSGREIFLFKDNPLIERPTLGRIFTPLSRVCFWRRTP